MLDFLKISNDEVFNLLIDKVNCEQIIVTDDFTAQEMLKNARTVPEFCKFAITPEFYRYVPERKNSNFGSYYINAPHGDLNLLIPVQDLDRQINQTQKKFEEEIADLKNQRHQKEGEMQNLNGQIREIQQNYIIKKNEIWNNIRQKISEITSQLQSNRTTIEYLEEQKKEREQKSVKLFNEEKEKKAEKKNKIKELEDIRQNTEKLVEKIAEESKKKVDLEQTRKEPERLLRSLDTNIKSVRNDLKKAKIKMAEDEKNLQTTIQQCNEREKEALKATNGKRLDVAWTKQETEAHFKQRETRKKELQKELGTNFTQIKAQLAEKLKQVEELNNLIAKNRALVETMTKCNEDRWEKLGIVREHAMFEVKRQFTYEMYAHNFDARIKFKKETISLRIRPRSENETEAKYVDLSGLSGGERSKTLVFLIHSLWYHLACPFRGLDEWDVFLDDDSRKKVEEVLVKTARKIGKQFFFISPQNTIFASSEAIRENGNLVKVVNLHKNK